MLASISFEAIEKRKVYQVEISFWKCVQVDWTEWPWVSFHPIGQPSGRHKIMAHKVKHLPRLILYRSVSQSSLVVRLSIDLAVLLRDDGRSHRNLSTALRRSSGLCGRGFRSCWCRVRHWCRCGWRSCRLRRWCRGTWSCWAPPVICRPSLTLVTTPPIPALPIGLSSRTAWVRPVRVPSLPPVPSTAAFKGLVAKLTALPAFNSLLKDWPLMSIALALGRPLDWVKMTPIPLSSFAGTRFCRSCQREGILPRQMPWLLPPGSAPRPWCCGTAHSIDVLQSRPSQKSSPEQIVSRLLIDRHHRTWPSKQRRRGFPPRFEQVRSKHSKLRKSKYSSMMSHHRFFRHVQRKPDVSVEVWHENQSSTDTCSQLLFSLLSGTADIWGNALCQVLQELATIRNDLADRIVKEIEWILLHAVLDRLEPQLRVSSRVGLSSVLEISEIASSSSTLVCSCAVRHSLSSRLLLKVDFVQRENFAGLLGRDFHPAYLCRNPPIRPCNQPFEAWLALVCAFDVLLPAEVALDLLHLKLCAVDIIFSISWALGLPSRAASLSLALSTAFAFANGFSIWKGTKGSHLQRQPVFKWSRRAFSSTKKWRNFFWGGRHLHLARMDGLAAHEVGLQTCPCIGVWARREGFSSRSILVLVLLHLCVVHSGDLVRSVDPGELTIHRVIRADDVLVGDPVRTDDCFIGPEQATAALNNELSIKGNIVLLSGSRSRKLFPSNWPTGATQWKSCAPSQSFEASHLGSTRARRSSPLPGGHNCGKSPLGETPTTQAPDLALSLSWATWQCRGLPSWRSGPG